MSHWQFIQGNDDITSSHTAERDATEVRLWDVSGELIIAAFLSVIDGKWHVMASDYFHQWTDYSDRGFQSYQDAITNMFLNTEHDHEASEQCDLKTINGREYVICDLCRAAFRTTDEGE